MNFSLKNYACEHRMDKRKSSYFPDSIEIASLEELTNQNSHQGSIQDFLFGGGGGGGVDPKKKF